MPSNQSTAVIGSGQGAATSPERLRALLQPTSIAVVGASSRPGRPGNILLSNIISGGFGGSLFPINPSGGEICGCQAHSSVAAVPEKIDLAVIVLPREKVHQAVAECAAAGVGAVIIVTAGFEEAGDEDGRRLQEELRELVAQTGLVAIGPNTIGQVVDGGNVLASFVPFAQWHPGPVAIVAQTGIFAGAPMAAAMRRPAQRLGVRASIDIGNRVGIDEIDLLAALGADPEVGVIGFYIEQLVNGRRFLELASAVKDQKPVVLLKPGRTSAGARASASHTGSLATDDAVLNDLLEEFGVIRARDEIEFLDLLRVFSYCPPPQGPSVGIMTYSGALGVIAADELVQAGLAVRPLTETAEAVLSRVLPTWQGARANPVDLWAAAEQAPALAFSSGLTALGDEGGIDAVLAVLLAIDPVDFDEMRDTVARWRKRYPAKPLHMYISGPLAQDWALRLDGLGVPIHASLPRAARSLALSHLYHRYTTEARARRGHRP